MRTASNSKPVRSAINMWWASRNPRTAGRGLAWSLWTCRRAWTQTATRAIEPDARPARNELFPASQRSGKLHAVECGNSLILPWGALSMLRNSLQFLCAALLCAAPALYATDKSKVQTPAAVDPYAETQPATETLDLNMYQRIRDEGLNRSHVMEFATALMDGIGPRLTGSPNLTKANQWTRDTLTKIGLENAHLEDWGEFGLGWQQLNTWARMVTPDTAVLIVQATPWSPSTPGPVTGDVAYVNIQTEKDIDQYKGKLEGKVVLFGVMREVPPVDKPLFERYTDKDLEEEAEFPVAANAGGIPPQMQARLRTFME